MEGIRWIRKIIEVIIRGGGVGGRGEKVVGE